MKPSQSRLFPAAPALPAGFRYRTEILSPEDEAELVARFADLPFKEFEFQGFVGKRRIVSFGWHYDFNHGKLREADDIPSFLLSLREQAAGFAGMASSGFQHVLVTEYGPGAAIGWHKDKAVFGEVVGVSLLSACPFRFRRKAGARWERATLTVEPRSAYLLQGPARTEWEHSIPAVESLRYSVTFRNFRANPR